MNFFHQLMEKPWAAEQGAVDDLHRGGEFSLAKPHVGLRVFLGVATVLFSLFFVVYIERMDFPDWQPLADPWLLWVNTAILTVSSVALHWAWIKSDQGDIDGVRTGLLVAGISAFAFLGGQLWVWRELVDLGYFASSNPANGFFYLLTGLHGVHLLGGLVAWARASAKVKAGGDLERINMSVSLCAVYWHFLLVVWLVLFGLLLFT